MSSLFPSPLPIVASQLPTIGLAEIGAPFHTVPHSSTHHLTSRLAKTKSAVVIEDLHVSGMRKNHPLAPAIADVGWGEFRRPLTDKAAWYGGRGLVASRWEPSSKTCSGCGWVDEDLTLADRLFCCEQCGLVVDRDLNAAIN
jgi:putative transposase